MADGLKRAFAAAKATRKGKAASSRPVSPSAEDRLLVLREAVVEHIMAMDTVMKGPSTYERGQRIAALVSKLQRAEEEAGRG